MNLMMSAAMLGFAAAVAVVVVGSAGSQAADGFEHRFADNGDVRIHYAAAGEGPLVVFVHGFPDFWYSWRHQMDGLRDSYRVVAMDLRGYNLSDKPPAQAAGELPVRPELSAARLTPAAQCRAARGGRFRGRPGGAAALRRSVRAFQPGGDDVLLSPELPP